MQDIKRHIVMAVIFVLFMLIMVCVATKSVKGKINKIYEHGCDIKFVNNTDQAYIFWMSWIDHPFLKQTKGKPWIRTIAEMKPKESWLIDSKQSAGLYTVTCRERWKPDAKTITKRFTIRPETIKIVITIVMVSPMDIPIIILKSTLRPVGGSKPN